MSRSLLGSLAAGLLLVACTSAPDPGSPASKVTPAPSVQSEPAEARTLGTLAALRALPQGPPPRVGYLFGTTYRSPAGSTTDFPGYTNRHWIDQVTPYDGGLMFTDKCCFEGTSRLSLLEGGQVEELGPACTSGLGAVSRGGSRIAWASFACPESGQAAPTLVHLRESGRDFEQPVTPEPGTNVLTGVAGFLGEDIVYSHGFIDGVFVTDLNNAPRRIRGLIGASDVHQGRGLIVGGSSADNDRSAVVVAASGDMLWDRSGASPYAFSPDGSRLLAYRGGGRVVLDASTGERLERIEAPGSLVIYQGVWESDDAVVLLIGGDDEQALVRADLTHDGRLERISDVVPTTRRRDPRFVLSR